MDSKPITHSFPCHCYRLSFFRTPLLSWLFIVLLSSYFKVSIHAQPLAEVGHYGENIGAVAVSETKGVINEGTRVRVMDLPLFGEPSFAGSVDVGAVPHTLQIVDSYAYSVSNTGKFHIINIANSSAPQIVGELYWTDWRNSLWVRRSGDYAYFTGCGGIRVVDIRNKNNPVLVATLPPKECAFGITGDGGYLYVNTSSNGNYVLDVYSLVNPANPVLIGSGPNMNIPRSFEHNGIAVFGDTLYAVRQSETYVLDIADRTQPRLKTTIPRSSGSDSALDVSNGILHQSFGNRTSFINLAQPNAPQFIQEIVGDYGNGSNDVAAAGPLSYSTRNDALWLTDQNSGTCRVLRSLTPGFGRAKALARNGNLLFVGAHNKIHVLDISNPISPTLISSKDSSWVTRLAVSGNYLYNIAWGNIEIYDFSNPANLVRHSSLTFPAQSVVKFSIKEDLAVLTSGNRVLLYTVGSNGTLTQRSTITFDGNLNAADFSGSSLYVAQVSGAVRVFNISDRANPTLVLTRNPYSGGTGGNVSCKVVGDKLHTLFGRKGYALFDIASPMTPIQMGTYPKFEQEGAGIDIAGNYVYLATHGWLGHSGVIVLNIANPNNISEAYSGHSAGNTQDVLVHNGYAYYAEDKGGLRIRNAINGTAEVSGWPIY